MGGAYKAFHERSIRDPDGFWGEQARLIDWHKPYSKVLDYSRPPFAKWYVSGETNLCHNAIDRHLAARADQKALVYISTEVAVVGVADPVKGQMPLAFAVAKDASKIASAEARASQEKKVMATVDRQLGAIGRPSRVHFVTVLPKTRSGKLLRRSIQALAEGRDPGDLTTIEDPTALEQIKAALAGN